MEDSGEFFWNCSGACIATCNLTLALGEEDCSCGGFMKWIRRVTVLVVSKLAMLASSRAQGPDALMAFEPVHHWELAYESGALWRVGGGGSPLDYVILPQLLTWRTPEVTRWAIGGRDLVLRSRFSVLVEPFAKGPESHFVGGAAGGLLEWWDLRRTQAFFFSAGGGVGLMDSRGYDVIGAQGQDFNFNWFMYAGSRWQRSAAFSASMGVYFQHISNRGQDKVNPGINSLGPMVNVCWRF